MRLSLLSLALAACANIAAAEDPDRENTYFNAKKVPPLLELTPDSFEKELKEAKWMMVKLYSPYCPHCQDYAPTFQTLYEFYYTQDPGRSGAEDDFYRTYDFKFASINCVAYFDLCSKNGVQSYPTTILYHNGEVVESMRGVQNMSVLSGVVESSLEKERPGSRPKPHEFLLPEPGDKTSPTGTVKEEVKEAGVKVPIPDAGKVGAAKEAPIDKTVQELAKTTSTTTKTQETAVGAKPKAGKVSATRPTWPIPTIIIPKPESTGTPNANGMSVELNAESFQNLVTLTQDPWFVKFYAPWCHHCQALAPTWEQLAKEMKGKLNIGEVNCDKEKRLCKDANVRGFPTLQFFKGGEHVEYQGLRGLGDLIKYTEKAVDAIQGVQDVDLAAFEELEQKEEVIFVYFYDHAVVTEDFMALEKLPLNLIGRAKLVRTSDPAMYDRFKITTWPRLVVSREGRPSYYQPLTPRAMRDVNQILEWMKSVWLPIVPELTATNSREIMDGKIVVLGILNREDKDSFQRAIKEMKSASSEWMDKQIQLFQLERQELRDAKQLRIEEAEDRGDSHALRQAKSIRIKMDMSDQKQVTFAWVDGVFWQRWVRSTYGIDVTDGERVIINDEDNKRYWDTTITGNYIIPSRTSILETINKVVASPPKIKPKLTINSIERIVFDIRVAFIEHPYLTGGCITGFALSALIWYRGRMRRARGGYFRVDESHGVKDLKDGLLGGASTNGKVD